MSWIWWVLLVVVAAAVGAYLFNVRRARKFDVRDAQKVAMSQLRQGVGHRPEDR